MEEKIEAIDGSRRVSSVSVIGIEPIVGDAAGFRIVSAGMHPSAASNSAVAKNLLLCGAAVSNADRRAAVRLRINYSQ